MNKRAEILVRLHNNGFKCTSDDGDQYQKIVFTTTAEFLKNNLPAQESFASHNSGTYCLTFGNWRLYIAELYTISLGDLMLSGTFEEGIKGYCIKEEIGSGCWIKTDDPSLELKTRLQDFEAIVLKSFNLNTQQFWGSPSLDYIPDDCVYTCKLWAESYISLSVPRDLIEAKIYIDGLLYKYRKMCELYTSIKDYMYLL